jgi:hypothetical protein
MKKIIGLFTTFLLLNLATQAQRMALQGSGKVETKFFQFFNFSNIQLQDLDGKVEVEVGKPYAVSVIIDDNLTKLLSVTEQNNTLTIKLVGNENNKLYIEETNIKVRISVPSLFELKNLGNSHTRVNNLNLDKFSVVNNGNGNCTLIGTAANLNILKEGNGSVDASNCVSKIVKVKANGNGDVLINSTANFTVEGTGNGDVTQVGKGLALNGSSIKGNGSIVFK